jgi:DNA mismatch repair ATPase MutS
MKVFLMHHDRDFALAPLPANADALSQDLELGTLLSAMAGGNQFLLEVSENALLVGLTDPTEIAYRQRVLVDCLEHPEVVREIYDVALEAIHGERRVYFPLYSATPGRILSRSVEVLELFVAKLRRLRQIADEHAGGFTSDGFLRLFAMLVEELDDAYFQAVEESLKELRFKGGLLISARPGAGSKGVQHMLRRAPEEASLIKRVSRRDRVGYSFEIHPRDEAGMRDLSDLRDRGVNLVANALGQSTDHIVSFFSALLAELAFYMGALNLHQRLAEKGEPICFPIALPRGEIALSTDGLSDVSLTLTVDPRVVGNDVCADGKTLLVITGANQGGKSTLLRSLGLAQLMMQCGMFVVAESFRANVCDGILSHYKRAEDRSMESGKLDEELARMSQIAEHITPGCMLLCNESFACTNEREGSEIARQIVRVLLEMGVKVLFVTHQFDFAHSIYVSDGTRHFSFAPSERPTVRARSSCARASRCPPATARTPSGASSRRSRCCWGRGSELEVVTAREPQRGAPDDQLRFECRAAALILPVDGRLLDSRGDGSVVSRI